MTKKAVKEKPREGKSGRYTPVLEKEKEAYILWNSIPAMLRLLPEAEQRKMGYDVDDPQLKVLMGIRSKTEFAAVFKVGRNTLYLWEAEEGFQTKVDSLSLASNVLKFKKEVDFKFTQKLLKDADAPRMKLWKQLYEGWSEKVEHKNYNMNLDVVALVNSIEERNKKLRQDAGVETA